MVHHELADMVTMWEKDAARSGRQLVFVNAFAAAINAFLAEPSRKHADELLQEAPMLEQLFQTCSPGGNSYETIRFLREPR